MTNDRIELWGGVECTVARIGEQWRNQIDELGILLDEAELQGLRDMNIRKLRFPVLWETISPDDPDQCEWRWHDERLALLRQHGIAPIAGLIHHGSGPHYTNLLDPRFPELLARHAEQVAQRYPWLDAYTPVNEPLTTARFSALYGHWYPHARDETSFIRALLNQCKATVLAMRAIRRVNPAAQLIQTDDLGKTHSTPALQHQADYENERRWLSYDLLHGRVDRHHPWYARCIAHGVPAEELEFFLEQPCPPDVIGINHYLTGERYLDENLLAYSPCFHGGNGREAYADVEAVRMHACEHDVGPRARLLEVWQRYGRPLAVTEVHHGCSRDEQLRWLVEVWNAAQTLQSEGVDIRAVTMWSLFGAVDWNTLLVQRNGFYEPGAFDARSTPPRPTVLVRAATALGKDGCYEHPILDAPGWWRRDERFYTPRGPHGGAAVTPSPTRRLLITGATGTLGRAFSRICTHRGLGHALLSRSEMDIAEHESVRHALQEHQPWAVINTAGYVRVPDAEHERGRCFRENAVGAGVLAAECARLGIPLVSFSSDLVFDGALGRPYVESDSPNPCCAYGMSKAEAEALVLQAHPASLLIRTSAFFGPWDPHNFIYKLITDLMSGRHVEMHDDLVVSPTYVPDLVHATLDLLIDGEQGLWHLANRGALSWYEFALHAAEEMKLSRELIARLPHTTAGVTALNSERGAVMPTLDSALGRYFEECELSWHAGSRA